METMVTSGASCGRGRLPVLRGATAALKNVSNNPLVREGQAHRYSELSETPDWP